MFYVHVQVRNEQVINKKDKNTFSFDTDTF